MPLLNNNLYHCSYLQHQNGSKFQNLLICCDHHPEQADSRNNERSRSRLSVATVHTGGCFLTTWHEVNVPQSISLDAVLYRIGMIIYDN